MQRYTCCKEIRASLLEMFDPRVLLLDNPSIFDVLRNLLPMTISDFFLLITSNISNTKEG